MSQSCAKVQVLNLYFVTVSEFLLLLNDSIKNDE